MDNHKEGYLLAAQLEEPGGIAGLDENGLVYKKRLPPIDFSQITLDSLNGEVKGTAAKLVNDEAIIRKQEDSKLQQQINQELFIRQQEDVKLQQITLDLSVRERENIKLQQQLNQEAIVRQQEDIKLQQQIANLSTKLTPVPQVWQSLVLLGGWVGNPMVQFVFLNGLVLVTGMLTKPTRPLVDEVIAILPIGYRPRQTQRFLSQGLSVTSRPCFEVTMAGEIKYQNIGTIPPVTNALTMSTIIFVPGG